MDWVEVFEPVVFEPYRPRAWPTSGSLLLDHLPFRVRDPDTGRTRIAFGSSRRWAMSAGGRSCGAWRCSQASLSPTGRRSSARFPARRRGLCATTTTALRTPLVLASPTPSCTCASGICATRLSDSWQSSEQSNPGIRRQSTSCCGRRGGVHRPVVLGAVRRAPPRRLSEWLDSTSLIVEDQFGRRGPRASRPPDTPLSTSPLDGFINPIRAAIGPRAYASAPTGG